MKKTTILIALLAVATFAQSSVWKISKGDNHLFLGGTVHLLRESDFPLPSEFDRAFEQCDRMVFETDMEKLLDVKTQTKLVKSLSCSGDSTLKEYLSPELYERVSTYLEESNLPGNTVDRFRPSLASLVLTQLELAKNGVSQEGVDVHLYNRAKEAKKRCRGLETVAEQIAFLRSLDEVEPNDFMTNTLDDFTKLKENINTIITDWRSGEMESLDSLLNADLEAKYPSVYETLIVTRNNSWFPKVAKMVRSKPVEMVLVGAAHLPGEHGLLTMFEKEGYTITQVK